MSSQPVETRTGPDGPARPETPPVPDESFWNDTGARAERADWMDALGEPGAEVDNGWVGPVTDDESDAVTTSGADVWAEPGPPVAAVAASPADDEIVFSPVPVADVVPIRPQADAVEAEDNLSWLDAGALDDLLPPA